MDNIEKNIVTNNLKNRKLYNTNFQGSFYFFAFMFLVIYSLSSLSDILTPIAIAFLIWFLINALANNIKKLPFMNSNFGKSIAIPISVIIIFLFAFEMGSYVGKSMVELSSTITQLDDKVLLILDKLSKLTSFDLTTPLQKLFAQFSLATLVNKLISAFSLIFSNILQIFLYVLFLLIDQQFFDTKINALFKNYDTRTKAKDVLHSVSKTIRMYLSITTIISIITGVITYFICTFFGLEGAVLWGFIAFVLNFIPTLGSIIAVLIPSAFALVQFSDYSTVLTLVICLVLTQFIIGNILYPRLMGNKLNISQFVVILSLVIWGAMWGTVGMFLSVPLMMILMIILGEFENTKPIAILISGDGKI